RIIPLGEGLTSPSQPMHHSLPVCHGLFFRVLRVLGLASTLTLAATSGFGQASSANPPATPAASDVQKMAESVITEAPAVPFQNGNMDLPRTSNDVQPYTMINQEAIL